MREREAPLEFSSLVVRPQQVALGLERISDSALIVELVEAIGSAKPDAVVRRNSCQALQFRRVEEAVAVDVELVAHFLGERHENTLQK